MLSSLLLVLLLFVVINLAEDTGDNNNNDCFFELPVGVEIILNAFPIDDLLLLFEYSVDIIFKILSS